MEFSQRTIGRLLLVSLASLAYSCYQETFSGFSGAAVVNASYFTFSTPSLLFCARRCRLQRKCLSFNFDVDNGECYLNLRSHLTPGTELQGGSPLQSFDISLWSEKLLQMGSCRNHSCRKDLVCSEEGEYSYRCLTDTQCQWNKGCTSCIQGSGQSIQTLVVEDVYYVPVGCYKAPGDNIGFPDSVNMRSDIDWLDMEATIRKCATETKTRGFSYFGIEFYAECYMRNTTLELSYQQVTAGSCETDCVWGVGRDNVLYFYQIV